MWRHSEGVILGLWLLLAATAACAVTLAWDASDRATGYRVYDGLASRDYDTVLDVGPDTRAVITGLTVGQRYYFAVTAYNEFGESDYSNEVSAVIEAPDPEPPPPAEAILAVQAVDASSDDGHVPANVLDGNLNTRWSARGEGEWIRFDLGLTQTITGLTIAWYRGDQRRASFEVHTSGDGTHWTTRLSGESSGTTRQPERLDLAAVEARYVRLVGYGNTLNLWNSITEVAIYGH